MRAFGPLLVRALSVTWKTEAFGIENVSPVSQADAATVGAKARGCLLAAWHGRMLVGVAFGRKRNWSVLVSPSGDGEITVRLLRALGYRVVRGSSSGGGARAVREMLSELRGGGVMTITPDGPRGPRHTMNPGLVWMSRATGFPVVPVGMVANRAWNLSSWDAFTIPKPFARVALVFGEPIQVAREVTESEMESATELIRERIFDCERRAFAHVGASEDW